MNGVRDEEDENQLLNGSAKMPYVSKGKKMINETI
jgi:hypothetical protein